MWTLRALRLGAILTLIVPARVGYWICRVVGFAFFVVNVHARRQVMHNLAHVTPRASRLRLLRQALGVFITVMTNYYDLLRFRSVDRDRLLDIVEIRGREHLDAALANGRGVIILSAHFGNFSVVAQYLPLIGIRSAIIAEQVEPPQLFRYMARLRSAMGIEIIPPGRGAIAPLLRLLRANGVLLVAGDRDIAQQGITVDFFGAPASLPAGPMLLAMRTGAVVLPAFTRRVSSRRSIVQAEPPMELIRTGDWDHDLRLNVQRMAEVLEGMIRTDPTQWAVLQAIWDRKPEVFQRQSEGLGAVPQGIAEAARDQATQRAPAAKADPDDGDAASTTR